MTYVGETTVRLNPIILSSTSLFGLLAAAPVVAQTAAPGSSPVVAVTDDTPDAIVVTGIRASLQSAQAIKRNSMQQIDSIVAEDIGKLPDIAVSDTVARIAGVQVDRLGGEASRVLVRGLPNFTTTYNGREIFTAETRVVALQDFPASNVAALEVYKTSTADLVEPGLAGLVNVRSRRPFDFKGFEASTSVWGLYTKQGDKLTPNFNGLITDRWETGIGEIGILVNGSYTEMQYLDSEPSNTDFIANPTINGSVVRLPDIQRLFYRSGNRVRPSVSGAIQWKPSPELEFYGDVLWQGFRNKISDRLVEVPLYGAQSYTNLVFRPGTNLVSSGTAINQGGNIFTFQGATFNKTDTYQYAGGGIYKSGPLKLSFDVAHSDSTFTGSTESIDRIFAGKQTINFNLEVPQFAIPTFVASNIANYTFQGLYEENQRSSGKDWQARVDATYSFDNFLLRDITVGARYTDRSAIRQFGNRYAYLLGNNIPASALPVTYDFTNPGFRGTNVQPDFRTFLSPTYDSVRANLTALRSFVIANGGTNYTTTPVNADTQYTASEETFAGYVQANYAIGDLIDGAVGVRVTKTRTRVNDTVATILPRQSDPVSWLPNLSIRFKPTTNLQLRLSATKTITRPDFGQLNPNYSLGPPVTNPVPNPSDPYVNARRGNSGNPFLKPLKSDNYDASLEYYFSKHGFASVAVFRRDLNGFIQNADFRFVDPALGPLIISAPVNSGRGRIDGAEVQLTTFFDFRGLPTFVHNFGVQMNYTYLDASTDYPDATGALAQDRILGLAKHSYNIVGIYENGPVGIRLTYNKRGKSLETRQYRGDDFYTEEATPPGRLDLSTNLDFAKNATLFFDATNLLNKPFRVDFSSARAGAPRASYVRFLRYEESTFSVGLRFKL